MSQTNTYSQQDSNRRQRAADALATDQPARGRQSGKDYLPEQNRPDPRGRDIDLDKISGILGGGTASDGHSSPEAHRPRSDRSLDDPGAGRGDEDGAPTNRKPRPALELDDDDDDLDSSRKQKAKKYKAISEFAEERELDPKEIYGLLVPGASDDGAEPITIGQMKDRLAEVRSFQQKADDFEDSRSVAMNEIFVARQQIDSVLRRIKDAIPAQRFAQIFSEVSEGEQQQLDTARRQVLEFFPEWRDAAVMQRDREMLIQMLGSYGITKIEVDTLRDARLIKLAMDSARLLERYKRVKGAKKDEPATREQPSTRKPPRQSADQTARQLADKGDVLGAVTTLLR